MMEASSMCPYQLEEERGIPKVPLFEKPLTPSDVGKLNRLVIPKQHAEKHFPSLRNYDDINDDYQKGSSQLSFEDDDDGECEIKTWRFRYSYWSSSQSYVLTRGWSRFVKEKRIRAGDIVVFSRHRTDTRRLFIGWRSVNDNRITSSYDDQMLSNSNNGISKVDQHIDNYHDAGSVRPNQTLIKTSGNYNYKKLRLFGVNLECQISSDESEPSTSDGSPISSQDQVHQNPYHQYYSTNHYDNYYMG